LDKDENGIFQVAIDGPSGAGKSTVAKAVAASLGVEYVDTGAMYRAVAHKMRRLGLSLEDAEGIASMLQGTTVDFVGQRLLLDGEDVTDAIRSGAVAKLASDCSALPAVREKLVAAQRAMGEKKSVVMDGRDIGSNVFPRARHKFYLTAAPEERARRRLAELLAKGEDLSFEQVLDDIKLRDHNDSHRALNPLTRTPDAVEIDSTDMTVEAVLAAITGKIMEDRGAAAQAAVL
jgi:cytidylate kinase